MTDLAAVDPAHRQSAHRVRLEWGVTGGRAIAEGTESADIAVVVDVLSFTTTVSVAVRRGIRVLPYPWRGERAEQYAAANDAVLALGRLEAQQRPGSPSLSPAAMAAAGRFSRVVLPSPNGSTICAALAECGVADRGVAVVTAALRNRAAVAAWLAPRVAQGAVLAVVPAGERWLDESLRPCAEDLWGAGALLAALVDAGVSDLSPEARLAVAAWRSVEADLGAQLRACASGRELVAKGFDEDVDLAAVLDVDPVVPVLRAGVFTSA